LNLKERSENSSEIKSGRSRALDGANQRSKTPKKESELDSQEPTELKAKRKQRWEKKMRMEWKKNLNCGEKYAELSW